ncbi:hypothetical protein N825_11595 [Skermanella stibiiresistens SB22]|uniref:Uncharacterized protein n=1 Tax=Skermanella stibiiresistens SB22 TaxID=1385369 RepID=W9GXF7_9PROT|nr:DUF484 family protein [Skermanella stibiiresistens]EWY37321.1 hypothetical protein N825_11595 [Skermanella stibiiresistens SB22]
MARETGHSQRTMDALTAEDVAAYLREHPDFLTQNADVVRHLTPPALERGNGVVDFQYFMVERLRGEVGRLKDQQRELITTTRANINNQNRIHAAVLFLLDARTFEQLIQTITTDLAVLLDLDTAGLVVEANAEDRPHVHASGVRVVEPGTVDGWLGKRDVMLYSDTRGDPAIFGSAAGLVRSQALIRIQVSEDTPAGLLAFGSRDPDMFHSGQGTELVCFLARVIERSIRAWLELPA